MATDVLGQPVDPWHRVNEVAEDMYELFPELSMEPMQLPEEAMNWSTGDLELFFATNGQLRPQAAVKPERDRAKGLLSHLRVVLAEWGIEKAGPGYLSFCQHLRDRQDVQRLPGVAECAAVQRLRRAPDTLTAPVVVENLQKWPGRAWDMHFWARQHGAAEATCRSRSPAFSQDAEEGFDCMYHNTTITDYVDYAQAIQRSDPDCNPDKALAYPRVVIEGWTPFGYAAHRLFEDCWRDLTLPGVKDLTRRWLKLFCEGLRAGEWLEYWAQFFRVTLGAAGTITRLCTENHSAHVWFYQIEGRRLFFLFPPRDSERLYQESGEPIAGTEGYAAAVSPVDIFFPRTRRHSKFSEARAQSVVLAPGEALVVPSGWWHYAVALESSVTLRHPFWNRQNRRHLVGEIKEAFEWGTLPVEHLEVKERDCARILAEVMEDDFSDSDDER